MNMATLERVERAKAVIDPNNELDFMESSSGDIYLINNKGEPQYLFVPSAGRG